MSAVFSYDTVTIELHTQHGVSVYLLEEYTGQEYLDALDRFYEIAEERAQTVINGWFQPQDGLVLHLVVRGGSVLSQ